MRNAALIALAYLLISVPLASGQEISHPSNAFGVKGDTLGETLQEFQAKNGRVIHSSPNAPIASTKQLPECSNDAESEALSADVDTSDEKDGIVKCIAALSVNDDPGFEDSPSISGIPAYRTVYYFSHEQLYKIESELPRSEYSNLRKLLIAKYGQPLTAKVEYENRFGAEFVGERLLWHRNLSWMLIGELDSQSNNVRLVMADRRTELAIQ